MCLISMVNVGKYTIEGSYGKYFEATMDSYLSYRYGWEGSRILTWTISQPMMLNYVFVSWKIDLLNVS